MKKSLLLAAAASILFASPALASGRCLELGQIYSFKALDGKTLIVEDDFHDRYKVSLLAICPQLTFKQGIGFRSFGGMALTCVTAGDDIITHNLGTGPQRCAIKKVEAYTPEMAKADADAAATKKLAGQH